MTFSEWSGCIISRTISFLRYPVFKFILLSNYAIYPSVIGFELVLLEGRCLVRKHTTVNRSRVEHLLTEAREKHVVVVGDVMLDRYVHGELETSSEPPFQKLRSTRQEHRLGGAANVALNLAKLGGHPMLVGVTGDDDDARILRSKLAGDNGGASIEPFLVIDRSRPTTVKARYINGNGPPLLRIDWESQEPVKGFIKDRLKRELLSALGVSGRVQGLIISDYQKGVITEGESGIFATALNFAHQFGISVYVDPKYRPACFYRGATVITPNLKEAGELLGRTLDASEDIMRAGPELLKATGSKAVLVTQGKEGMTLFESSDATDSLHISASKIKAVDVVGAGDTVISVMTLMCVAGATFSEAALIANVAAGIVVSKPGTSTCTPREIIDTFG